MAMFIDRPVPYVIRTSGMQGFVGNQRVQIGPGDYLVGEATNGLNVCLLHRTTRNFLAWVEWTRGDVLYWTCSIQRYSTMQSLDLPPRITYFHSFLNGPVLGAPATNTELDRMTASVPIIGNLVILGRVRQALAGALQWDQVEAACAVVDERFGAELCVDGDFIIPQGHEIERIDASLYGARHAVSRWLRANDPLRGATIIVAASFGLQGLLAIDGYGPEELGTEASAVIFEPHDIGEHGPEYYPYIREVRQRLLVEQGHWARAPADVGDFMFIRDCSQLALSTVRLHDCPPPEPLEQDLETGRMEISLAADVWVWNGNMGGTALSPRAPFPLQRNRWASYESPFRGYVRGKLVGTTRQFAIVAVTHYCKRTGRDLIKVGDNLFLYGQDEPLRQGEIDWRNECGRENPVYPPEAAYATPVVALFELGNVRAWGPWEPDPNRGEGMIAHIVAGSPEILDDEVPLVELKTYLFSTPREVWEMLPLLATAYKDFEEYAQNANLPDPIAGTLHTSTGFDPTKLSFQQGPNGTWVGYDGELIHLVRNVLTGGFNPDLLVQAAGPLGTRLFYDGDDVGFVPAVTVTETIFVDVPIDRPVYVPTHLGRDGEWLLDGLGAFMDGSWVRDAHNALHGVWMAADRMSGMTASAGVSAAIEQSALGVAHAIAAGGVGQHTEKRGWDMILHWPQQAYNWVAWHIAITIAGASAELNKMFHGQRPSHVHTYYQSQLRRVGYDHTSLYGKVKLIAIDVQDHYDYIQATRLVEYGHQLGLVPAEVLLAVYAGVYVLDRWLGLVHRQTRQPAF